MAQLAQEGPVLGPKLRPLFADWRAQKLSSPELVSLIVLTYLHHRKGDQFLSSPFKPPLNQTHVASPALKDLAITSTWSEKIWRRLSPHTTLYQLISQFAFYGMPVSINRALTRWYEGSYPLQLWMDIPTPEQLLKIQTEGVRGVTVFEDEKFLSMMINPLRDPFEFILHDLEHADRFFLEPQNHRGQLGFFKTLYQFVNHPQLQKMYKEDSVFQHEFDYLMADMNSYSVHMLQYMKAISLGYYLRQEGKTLKDILSDEGQQQYESFCLLLTKEWQMNESSSQAFFRMNTPTFNLAEDALILDGFFSARA